MTVTVNNVAPARGPEPLHAVIVGAGIGGLVRSPPSPSPSFLVLLTLEAPTDRQDRRQHWLSGMQDTLSLSSSPRASAAR